MVRRPSWVWPTVVWVLALSVAAATWAVRGPVAGALGADPTVGGGRLAVRAVAGPPSPVLPAPSLPDTAPDAAALSAAVDAVTVDGVGEVVAVVLDARTGATLYRSGAGARTPASSLKVLSGLVALDVLGGEERFATSTWLAPDGTLVLQGGGDPLLASSATSGHPAAATLDGLAAATASALRSRGVDAVGLAHDASLFAGPAWNPAWPEVFDRSVAPVTALMVDHARLSLVPEAFERHPDPPAQAAERFAAALTAAGVTATPVGAAGVPPGATRLAEVESPPVRTLVEQSLLASDNDTAEVLGRHVALARGAGGGPSEAAAVIADELRRLGLWSDDMAVQDANGIAGGNQVTADALAAAVRMALLRPDLRPVATGLPVAGVTGTLDVRFDDPAAADGRGVVHAKTGTIRGVNTLTGYAVTAGGHPVTFSFLVSGGAGQTSARTWLDRAAAAVAACDC